ncbi:MAG: periplasmic heavy metal sensor [Candidatus Poribacteria bacterium]|nr:periplasmic heavy metal sensor [Candidatus Poribacteria bacterium]MDE0504542.1 periplasmic heavy metal sensor [Candidatus Poribacteria bacterium]
MKTRTVVTICIALLTVGIMASTAYSRGGHSHEKDKKGYYLKSKMMKMLSEEQRQQLKSLKVDHAKHIIPLKADMKVKRLELKQLWAADELDEDAILAKSDEVLAIGTKIRQAGTRHKLETAKLLTKEQREMLTKARHHLDGCKKKAREFRGRRHHRDRDEEREMRHRDRHERRKHRDAEEESEDE